VVYLQLLILFFVFCFSRLIWNYCVAVFTCDSMQCFAHLSHRLGIRLSIHHTAVLCQNDASYDHEIFTVGCPKDSSLSWQNFVPMGEEIPFEWRRQSGVHPVKRRYFAAIRSYSVKTVADRYILAAHHNKHWWWVFRFVNIDDLERPWTSKGGVSLNFFHNFWLQCTFQQWMATKWLEID